MNRDDPVRRTPRHAPRTCPACGADSVRRIAYGFPDISLMQAAERGEVVLGGCIIDTTKPTWACTACGERGGHTG